MNQKLKYQVTVTFLQPDFFLSFSIVFNMALASFSAITGLAYNIWFQESEVLAMAICFNMRDFYERISKDRIKGAYEA